MLTVLGCIFEQHDLRLVVLAGLRSVFFACATAMSMIRCGRRSARARGTSSAGRGIVAGAGIWGTHFVAMLAYHSFTSPGLSSLTLLSAADP